jgi:hypothetical protein
MRAERIAHAELVVTLVLPMMPVETDVIHSLRVDTAEPHLVAVDS